MKLIDLLEITKLNKEAPLVSYKFSCGEKTP